MEQQYLIVKARSATGQTVKNQELDGSRFTLAQRAIAQQVADQLAAKMTARTGVQWTGFLETYTPSVRRSS
jgi:nitrate/TMAO reductase-like tetraheme cytochrome c subunit